MILAASLVFLTPLAALVALVAAVPLAALALVGRRESAVRKALRLPAPPPARVLRKALLLAAVVALLGLACAQPALRATTTTHVRTDAQAMFVIDTSRSMLASKGPHGETRLAQAQAAAIAIRNDLSEIPSGVASFTDRVLPALLPNPDPGVFANTVKQAIAIEEPPPDDENVIATDLGALGVLATGNYFAPSARKRVAIILTDGESRPFPAHQVADLLANDRIKLLLVHVSAPGESVYDDGVLENGYHEDYSGSTTSLQLLGQATGAKVVGVNDVGSAASAAEAALGTGPTVAVGHSERTRTLAPFVALLALIPLLLLAREGSWRRLGTATKVVARSVPVASVSSRLRSLRPSDAARG